MGIMDSAADFHSDPATVIEARQLAHRYGSVQALADIDLRVPAGQVCALLGRNGAGKTTFIRCALGLVIPDRGRLRVLGATAGSTAARLGTGAMLQDTRLVDTLTPREQLQLFASYYHDPAPVDTIIAESGIDDFADRRYRRLSGGQQRRAQFALALIGRPRLLFLDEPTTGLDTESRQAVWSQVRRLAADGTTVILTTHYLEEADALADRVVVLSHGRILADDTTANIRRLSGGAVIRCRSALSVNAAASLPGARAVSAHGRLLAITSDYAPDTLRALLAEDPGVDDLEVRRPSLEEAFASIASPSPGDT